MLQRYITRPFEVSAMVYTGRNSDDIMSTFQSEIISMDCKNGCLQLEQSARDTIQNRCCLKYDIGGGDSSFVWPKTERLI